MIQSTKESDGIFCCIPDEIGKISISRSTTDDEKLNFFKSLGNALMWTLIAVGVFILILMEYSKTPILADLLIVADLVGLVYAWIRCFTFKGYDYFLGSKGLAFVHFKRSRKHFKKEVFLFSDIADIKFIDGKNDVVIIGRGSEKPVLKNYHYHSLDNMACEFWESVRKMWMTECKKRNQIYQMVINLLNYEDA